MRLVQFLEQQIVPGFQERGEGTTALEVETDGGELLVEAAKQGWRAR